MHEQRKNLMENRLLRRIERINERYMRVLLQILYIPEVFKELSEGVNRE
ncbi:MAG: hypothetical protein ACTSQS_09150 [Promethearchaeota archaeon]